MPQIQNPMIPQQFAMPQPYVGVPHEQPPLVAMPQVAIKLLYCLTRHSILPEDLTLGYSGELYYLRLFLVVVLP